MAVIGIRHYTAKPVPYRPKHYSFKNIPVLGLFIHKQITRPWLLLTLRIFFATFFLLLMFSGLFGTTLAERNLITILTWTVWWSGLIMVTWLLGSVWCAICPWDVIATWLVRLRLWQKGSNKRSLQRRVPRWLRNVWPASAMLLILTWTELGFALVNSPVGTTILALSMLVMALVSQLFFERKPFCRYFCSVGRTVGFYAALSPVALRPVEQQVCAKCKTLECYHGTEVIEPCPTFMVLGRSKQNTFCTSCGACSQSCPKQNINWSLRRSGEELVYQTRPRWDEAWFILILFSLTSFHGITKLPGWSTCLYELSLFLGLVGSQLWAFTLGMLFFMAIPILIFTLGVKLFMYFCPQGVEYRRLFSVLALPLLPLAFAYHLAHNLNFMLRENNGLIDAVLNPLGSGTAYRSQQELLLQQVSPVVPQDFLYMLQASLIILGFWLASRTLQQRLRDVSTFIDNGKILINGGMFVIITDLTLFQLLLLMQPIMIQL